MQDTPTNSSTRKSRVMRLKRIIINLGITVIVLSFALCLFLTYRVHKLETQVDELYRTRTVTTYSSVKLPDKASYKTTAKAAEEDPQPPQDQKPISVSDNTLTQDNKLPAELLQVNEIEQDVWPHRVYLTFDDGPSFYTDDILDILDQYGVKGNFFVVGTSDPELKKMYKRIVDEGHVLGMHSYSHKYQMIYRSLEAFTDDLNRLRTLLYEETGVVPTLYRFPGGSSNTVSPVSMGYFIDYLKACNITYYDWNISSGDASGELLPAEDIVKNSLYGIDENEEAMILLHDLGDKPTTVEALPAIIEELQKREIPISTIDNETNSIRHILEQ